MGKKKYYSAEQLSHTRSRKKIRQILMGMSDNVLKYYFKSIIFSLLEQIADGVGRGIGFTPRVTFFLTINGIKRINYISVVAGHDEVEYTLGFRFRHNAIRIVSHLFIRDSGSGRRVLERRREKGVLDIPTVENVSRYYV